MTEESKGLTAIIPATQNPPTFGFIVSLYNIAEEYEKIYIILQEKAYVFKSDMAKRLLEAVLCKYSTKFVVIVKDIDFSEVTILDDKDLPPYDVILSMSVKIYSNLLSKGYDNVKMIPSLSGYDETFHRLAFMRSTIYNDLKKKLVNYK